MSEWVIVLISHSLKAMSDQWVVISGSVKAKVWEDSALRRPESINCFVELISSYSLQVFVLLYLGFKCVFWWLVWKEKPIKGKGRNRKLCMRVTHVSHSADSPKAPLIGDRKLNMNEVDKKSIHLTSYKLQL